MSDLFETTDYPDYLKALPTRTSRKYGFVQEIKAGKSGMTYLLKSKSDEHFYCLKTVSPTVTRTEDRERVRQTLEKEVTILKPLSHRCLPTIYEHELKGSRVASTY